MKYKYRRGFTLMEMLLVTTLVSVIGVCIFQTFSNGLKLWARGVSLDHEGDLAIGLDKLGADLHAVLPFTQRGFKGTGMKMSFAALVLTAADRNSSRAMEGVIDQIGAIEYRFEPAEGKMYRRQANYAQALKGQWGPDQEVMSGLEEVMFQYYFPGGNGTTSEAHDKIPLGVVVQVHERGNSSSRWFKRFFAIPVGG